MCAPWSRMCNEVDDGERRGGGRNVTRREEGDQKGQERERWGWKDGSTLYQSPRGRGESESYGMP
jgi:hypothetical protein